MVPSVELPPATPLISQVTDELDEPATVATNVCVEPERTLALAGATETAIEPAGFDSAGPDCVERGAVEPHPACTKIKAASAI